MQLYTIGHSTYPIEHFLERIKKNNVQYVIDVRSIPYSKYASQYNSNVLKEALKRENIEYFHMGKAFGARQEDTNFYPNGYLDFELFRNSDIFIRGMKNIESGLEKYNIALMCTEKNPIDCHRAIMVGRGFELDGVDVKHILPDGSVMTQDELNSKLLDMFFPGRSQLSLFDLGNEKSEEEYLKEAYVLRNKDIGYKIGSEHEGGDN